MAACGGAAMVEQRALVDPSAGVLEDGYSSGEGNQQKVGTSGELCDHSMKPSSSNEDSSNRKEDDILESARAEMGEVREENERLKMMLQRIEKDYKCLQLRFFDILQQETTSHKPSDESNPSAEDTEEPELVSLCLGRSAPSDQHKKDHGKSSGNSHKATRENIGELNKASLTLGLDSDSKFEVSSDLATVNPSPPEESIQEVKEEEAGETSKVAKRNNNTDEEVVQQNNNQVKRARVCVRARCDTPTMNDGCQWRKYGQKIAKGNPCPRAYYRCTVAPACPVRKQVQRCADDMSILITTYEGTHNHPLPVSATAMASTTSAAASMLLARSSTSQQQPGLGSRPATEHNVGLYDNARTNQFYYLPNSSATTFPTITLDLTTTPSTSSSAAFNRFSSSFASMPRFPSTSSLSFSSTESNILPAVWSSNNGYQNFSTLPFANTSPAKLIGPLSTALGKQHQEQTYQPYINTERNHQAASTPQALTETLTKAITSDPSFQTVIALAITSMIGSGGASGNQGPVESLSQNLKLGEPNQGIMSTTQKGKAGCAPAYFNALPSSSTSQPAGLLQPPLPFSIFNSASSTPTSKKEQKS